VRSVQHNEHSPLKQARKSNASVRKQQAELLVATHHHPLLCQLDGSQNLVATTMIVLK
jgi:hypothetical protein